MESVITVYKTDAMHSYASRDLIGIATDYAKALTICREQAKKERCKIEEDQVFNLMQIKQTQGYGGEGEFVLERLDLNTLF